MAEHGIRIAGTRVRFSLGPFYQLMPFGTEQEKLAIDKIFEVRIAALSEKLRAEPPTPINFENLYTGDALKATAPYGGLVTIIEAYGRIRKFVRDFENLAESEPGKLTPEILQRAEEAREILRGINVGESLEEVDPKAADLIARDVLHRAKALKDAGVMAENTRAAINTIYSGVRQLLDEGRMGKAESAFTENIFPLAWTMQKVKEIERIMEGASARYADSEILRAHGSSQKQIRARKKK